MFGLVLDETQKGYTVAIKTYSGVRIAKSGVQKRTVRSHISATLDCTILHYVSPEIIELTLEVVPLANVG